MPCIKFLNLTTDSKPTSDSEENYKIKHMVQKKNLVLIAWI